VSLPRQEVGQRMRKVLIKLAALYIHTSAILRETFIENRKPILQAVLWRPSFTSAILLFCVLLRNVGILARRVCFFHCATVGMLRCLSFGLYTLRDIRIQVLWDCRPCLSICLSVNKYWRNEFSSPLISRSNWFHLFEKRNVTNSTYNWCK